METKKENAARVVCFGEILWDVLPSKAKPGGAPMNVAYHLDRLGIQSVLVSRVGDDPKGHALLELLKGWDLSVRYCQLDHLKPTSEVLVELDAKGEGHYEIVEPVAWDFISCNTELTELVRNSDAFVFGSLSARNAVTRQTLFNLLEESRYNIFDVNLRQPHYDSDTVLSLLGKTNLLKLNLSELDILSSWVMPGGGKEEEEEKVRSLQHRFKISEVLVTKGANGVSYYRSGHRYDHPAYRVKVLDTVGSGDAFLAAFLAHKFKIENPDVQLSYASALGAFVAGNDGACPEYTVNDLAEFIAQFTVKVHV